MNVWQFNALILLLINGLYMIYCSEKNKLQCKSNMNIDFVNIERFTDNMCAQCLYYMTAVEIAWKNYTKVDGWRFNYNHTNLFCKPDQLTGKYHCTPFKYSDFNINNKDNDSILSEFKHEFHLNLFLKCCEDAKKCCEYMQELDPSEVAEDGKRCPAKWDGWMCWNSAERASIDWQTCPDISHLVLGYMPTECGKEYASKECYPNGTWATIWRENRDINNVLVGYDKEEYTNYTKCSTCFNQL